MDELHLKKLKLEEIMLEMGNVLVAYSSGVDSAFLLKTAHDILGERAAAVTACSPLFPDREINEAKEFCASNGVSHFVFETDELSDEKFRSNPVNRCYICKKGLFFKILEIAKEQGFDFVAEGSNTDDEGDYRPGMAAIAELGIRSPLREAGLSKQDIRALSKEMGLSVWNKPSFACLASRFPYGEEINEEKLRMVEEAEKLLFGMGFTQLRVRVHGKLARIELLPSEASVILEDGNAKKVNDRLRSLGFEYVSLDLGGYVTGSMNRILQKNVT